METKERITRLEEAIARLQYRNQELEDRVLELEMHLDFSCLDESHDVEPTAAERDQMEFDDFFDEESERFGEEM